MIEPRADLFQRASAFIAREAQYLDDRDWQKWLELYAVDAKLWAPAWLDDYEMTSDPTRQTSLIYAERTDLEARAFRIESDDSYASMPLPQTSHIVTCTHASEEDGKIHVKANWLVHYFWRTKGGHVRAGRYQYILQDIGHDLRIVLKKIIIHDDRVVGPIDIYNI